jgi:tetratricopeptide (TPR) repeat protein
LDLKKAIIRRVEDWKEQTMTLPRHLQKRYILYLAIMCVSIELVAFGQRSPQITTVTPGTGVTTPGEAVLVSGIGFSSDAVVYFGGLQARDVKVVSPTIIEAVTPFLRPGQYQLYLKSRGVIAKSDVTFTAARGQVDSDIDRAEILTEQGQVSAAIKILNVLAETSEDYQVRAFAHYKEGQIYFSRGDWWLWKGQTGAIFLDADKSGIAVQTFWRYRLAFAQSLYYLEPNSKPGFDLGFADSSINYDVTQSPELKFYRSMLNARAGNLAKAKADSDFILQGDPNNASYRVLNAYIAVLGGDGTQLQSLSYDDVKNDPRAMSLLGEAAYLAGDTANAQRFWRAVGQASPQAGGLACLAGKKHLAQGDETVARALLKQCITMAPNSKEGKEAVGLLPQS